MITYIDGDLFESPAKVLVNTVNTVGVMGKGIALRFKRIYPDMFKAYRNHCEHGRLKIGCLYLHKTPHKWILNFPTKKHWRHPSHVEYIELGLQKFATSYGKMGITSIAFPELGCGNGELDYETQVKPLMEQHLGKLSVPTFIYVGREQVGPPEHKDAKRISDWLRSDPVGLPFDEVWQDILLVLRACNEFRTPGKENPYTVNAAEDIRGIIVKSSGKTYRMSYDELLEFWQQLRDYGLTHRSITADHYRISYLIPLFTKLSYVQPISVSDSRNGLRTNPAAGLQVIPRPVVSKPPSGDLFANIVDVP